MNRRKRPKKFNLDPSLHANLRTRWRKWLPAMQRDMSGILGKREIFWELQDVAKENQKILRPGDLFDWMCQNYIAAISIEVRGFRDQNPNSRSLWNMLYQILENPGILDRESHARMYRKSGAGIDYGRECFDNVVGRKSTVVTQQTIRSDLRRIEDTSEIVRKFVNKRIAHRTKRGELRRLPKFNELDSAIDNLDRTLCKYNFLLTGDSSESCFATRQYNWQEVLWEPWIPKGSKLHPDSW